MTAPTIVEKALLSMLSALPSGAPAYALFTPQNTPAPYFLFGRVDSERDFTLQGATGLVDARFEITAYASSYLAALDLAGEARQVLHGFMGTVAGVEILACRLDTDTDIFEADTAPKLFGSQSFYLISYREI